MNFFVSPREQDVQPLPHFARPPRTQMPGLALASRNLRKSFGGNEILRGIDLDIQAGQFVAIVGRSGCGKSTLLRLLVGLETPTGGDFWFDAGLRHPAARQSVRIMFQEPRLLPWANVQANVEVGLRGPTRSVDRKLARAALGAAYIEDKHAAWPASLSGGQRQRVALARALVSRPRFLALDEPLGALDALTRMSMQRLIEEVWLEQGFTAVLVTHDVSEALALADRVIMLEHGQVTMDLAVTLPRPRRRGSPEMAALEGQILGELFQKSPPGQDVIEAAA